MKEEKISLNIAKSIGIILIVAGHSFVEESDSFIRSFVYLFHVPLFFIISGYFYKDEYTLKPFYLVIRRIKTLWWPHFYWSAIFILLHNFFFKLHIYGDHVFRGVHIEYKDYSILLMLKKIFDLFLFKGSEKLLGAFWFLPCLFFTVMIFMIFNIIALRMNRAYLLPVLCFLGFISGNLMIYAGIHIPVVPWDFRFYSITTFLYYLGYLYKNHEDKVRLDYRMAFAALLLLIIIDKYINFKIVSINSVIGNPLTALFYLVLTPVLGTYLVLYISKKLENFKISGLLSSFGKKTITILALHFLCFKIVNYIIIRLNDLDISLLSSFPVIKGYESWFILYLLTGVCVPVIMHNLFSICKRKLSSGFK